MAGPAATIGSLHVCPMCNGTVPHIGGPVTGPGSPNVLINGKPAAVMGDMCTCAGPPDTIVQGEATVLINGKPAATLGCMTAHGGTITIGEPTVLIGTGASARTEIMPIKKIPFPEIKTINRVMSVVSGKSKLLNEALTNQEALKKQAEEHAEEDKKRKDEINTINTADSTVYATEKLLDHPDRRLETKYLVGNL